MMPWHSVHTSKAVGLHQAIARRRISTMEQGVGCATVLPRMSHVPGLNTISLRRCSGRKRLRAPNTLQSVV
jgi:hypothetical protein